MRKNVLAFDIGASTGRAIVGKYESDTLELEEIHRFENRPITINQQLHWNIQELMKQIEIALYKATQKYSIASLAIDTWGVDFGLLDSNGELVEAPFHYRDKRTQNACYEIEKMISASSLYQKTGIQVMPINTLFQLWVDKKENPQKYDQVQTLLLMPDLMNYLLTGNKQTEVSIASTTQLMNPITKKWDFSLIERLGLKKEIFTEIVQEGTTVGTLKKEYGVGEIPVINICAHDTASAVVSIPSDKKFLFVSCGTWSLVGTEITQPVLSQKAKNYNLTNETGVNKTTRLLKNITGLWIIQELKKDLANEGFAYSYDEITQIAQESKEFVCMIDTDDPSFLVPHNMKQKIIAYAKKTNQILPQTHGELFRVVYESLALNYRKTFEELMDTIEDHAFETIHMVGGGIQAKQLCQMVANASGKKVIAGPTEATAIGNILVQLMTHGCIQTLAQARNWVRDFADIKEYTPVDEQIWNVKQTQYQEMIDKVKQSKE